jgi:ATP-dependent DNA helicase RecQ
MICRRWPSSIQSLLLNPLPAVDTLELSPLAFPANPYHSLVKDYKLVRDSRSDPLKDAQLSFKLWADQHEAFTALQQSSPDELACHHFFLSRAGRRPRQFFRQHSGAHAAQGRRDSSPAAGTAPGQSLSESFTAGAGGSARRCAEAGRAFSYVLAWLRVSGGNSVLPPWVRLQYPTTSRQIRQLRETSAAMPICPYCTLYLDPRRELERYFGFSAFRAGAEKRHGWLPAGGHRRRRVPGRKPARHSADRRRQVDLLSAAGIVAALA